MARIGFIGLGKMGSPMARNLLSAGHEVIGFDVVPAACDAHAAAGGRIAAGVAEAVADADVVITMLPTGRHVRDVYLGESGIVAVARPGTLLIDSSTIDVESARAVAEAAAAAGLAMLDAPVSGGTVGAEAATLTFMVGGPRDGFDRAAPILRTMGRTVVHAGASGNGQAAKICNNMMCGIAMIGVAEAFALAEKLGLDAQTLFDVSSTSSGQCWSLTTYCPVPGPVPTSPANKGYEAGFAAALMLKDLTLAQQAAAGTGAATPLGTAAVSLYALYVGSGRGDRDFSGIVEMLRGAA
ncbi:MAG: 3-hydroxyisobutyrate dehydrogenase [Rhodovulum sp.]|nr:3-hydroxyisobutyrate dehydrogenase [Rhodovulum sp.]